MDYTNPGPFNRLNVLEYNKLSDGFLKEDYT